MAFGRRVSTSDRKTTRLLVHILNDERPVLARARPPVLPATTQPGSYRGRFVCASVLATQETEVRRRGRLVRLIAGVPVVARHSTHTNPRPV